MIKEYHIGSSSRSKSASLSWKLMISLRYFEGDGIFGALNCILETVSIAVHVKSIVGVACFDLHWITSQVVDEWVLNWVPNGIQNADLGLFVGLVGLSDLAW